MSRKEAILKGLMVNFNFQFGVNSIQFFKMSGFSKCILSLKLSIVTSGLTF